MPLAQANAFCTSQAQNYARQPIPIRVDGTIQIGLLAEMPDDFMVQDFYRRCVFAKSGQQTSGKVKWRL